MDTEIHLKPGVLIKLFDFATDYEFKPTRNIEEMSDKELLQELQENESIPVHEHLRDFNKTKDSQYVSVSTFETVVKTFQEKVDKLKADLDLSKKHADSETAEANELSEKLADLHNRIFDIFEEIDEAIEQNDLGSLSKLLRRYGYKG